jgi:hypothetical protein
MTPKHDREIPEYAAMLLRMVKAYGRRVATGDEVDLCTMLIIRGSFDEAVQTAVDGMRASGHSWAYIAKGAGMTRQAAQQRWGRENQTSEPLDPARSEV